MALLGNYNTLNSNPGRSIGGPTDLNLWRKTGTVNLFYAGDHEVAGSTDKSSFPDGYRPPYAWHLAPKAGAMSSHNEANITTSQTALLVGGKPISGSADITLTTTATGGLIVSGSGSASITFSATGQILSVAAGSGSATITLSGSALIGALAGLTGNGSITLTPAATIRAVGFLSGLSTSETEFSAGALAAAVWAAVAADYNEAGTMGNKLNSSASAGDPWTTELPGAYADGTAGQIVGQKLLTTGKFVALK